ncbi:hypothetical protein B4135_1361 [Caldibacillus debilis]|uniref:Uncharacterized protein n=1 Tax=Caldibacillus debilis TaxID=301148 RepID=A0A150MCS1_9BACI|nr:hypothetical protein B4135_1361 [Caldibacillus debilis]
MIIRAVSHPDHWFSAFQDFPVTDCSFSTSYGSKSDFRHQERKRR